MSPKRRREHEPLLRTQTKPDAPAHRSREQATTAAPEAARLSHALPGVAASAAVLQRTLGNAGFSRLLHSTAAGAPTLQRAPAADTDEELLTPAQVVEARAYYRNRPGLYTTEIISKIQSELGVEDTGAMNDETISAVAAFQSENPPLQVDGKAGPRTLPVAFPVGLASKAQQETFAQAAMLVQAGWGNLKTKEERAEAMTRIANDRLAASGVPPMATSVIKLDSGEGAFNFPTWTMRLNQEVFSKATLDKKDEKEIATTVYHEARHAEQWFMMARMRAGQGVSAGQIAEEMGIPSRIAALAKAKPLARGSMEALEAFGWFDSVYGTQRERRNALLTDIEQKDIALKKAKAAFEKNKTPANQAKLDAAQAAFDKSHARYKDLPEEFDAFFVADKMAKIFEAEQP